MNSGNKQAELYQQAQMLEVNNWGKTLIVAPHQDDESLGCGGVIALVRKNDIPVEVIFTSNGSMSHPNSKQYPSTQLIALREKEALSALGILGVNKDDIYFMRLQDSQVPAKDSTGFDDAVQRFLQLLNVIEPAIILVPWRRDPHKDHRATAAIVQAALLKANKPIRLLEYLIWLWERGEANEFPDATESKLWCVDIEKVKHLKKQAVAAHLSQTTRLIEDDPDGFILSPEVLAHFDRNYELFVEMNEPLL